MDEYMQHSETNGSKYFLTSSCSFFQDYGPLTTLKVTVVHHKQCDVTYKLLETLP